MFKVIGKVTTTLSVETGEIVTEVSREGLATVDVYREIVDHPRLQWLFDPKRVIHEHRESRKAVSKHRQSGSG